MSSSSSLPFTVSKLVFETLDIDAKRRHVGVSDEHLFKFSDLKFNRQWDYSLPTLVKETTYSTVGIERPTIDAYRKSFYKQFPELKNVDFTNVLIAGGCPGHFLYCNDAFEGDVDMFLYGLDRKDADRRVCTLVKDLVAAYKRYRRELLEEERKDNTKKAKSAATSKVLRVKLVRNGNGMTLFLRDGEWGPQLRKYQIIFRLYSSKSEILHGFDVGSSAVGFDGDTLYFTALSRFSHEFRCNIVDTSRRSTTYEIRIKKYWERGYEIILPFFDISKIRKDYLQFGEVEMVIMPHLVLTYTAVQNNQIVVKRFLNYFDSSPNDKEEKNSSTADGEQETTDYALEDVDEYNLLFINIRHLLSEPERMYHFHQFYASIETPNGDEKETIETFFERPPFLSVKSINYFYQMFRNKVYSRKQLSVAQLQKYITVASIQSIAQRIFIDGESAETVLDHVVQAQRKHVLELCRLHAKNSRPIPWITENPGTQLTSSINPIFQKPSQWYGEYYKPPEELQDSNQYLNAE